jgi:hypothetical protein
MRHSFKCLKNQSKSIQDGLKMKSMLKTCVDEEGGTQETIEEKAIEFFQDIFAHNYGLAFGRSWET